MDANIQGIYTKDSIKLTEKKIVKFDKLLHLYIFSFTISVQISEEIQNGRFLLRISIYVYCIFVNTLSLQSRNVAFSRYIVR